MILFFFFFFNDTATTEIYTLSLHDALPILPASLVGLLHGPLRVHGPLDARRELLAALGEAHIALGDVLPPTLRDLHRGTGELLGLLDQQLPCAKRDVHGVVECGLLHLGLRRLGGWHLCSTSFRGLVAGGPVGV